MHSSTDGEHISGAEAICGVHELESLTGQLFRRALEHEKGAAESIRISVDLVPAESIEYAQLPPLRTHLVGDYHEGREVAQKLLETAGVCAAACRRAMSILAQGAAPDGRSMRGAMLVDSETGERLERDQARGVRVSRMDLTAPAREKLQEALLIHGLDNPHVREALVLAGKVLCAPGMVAELCWSDDPMYTAGYVAAPGVGYVRFPHLKPVGEKRGGRAFFFRKENFDLQLVTEYLEKTVVLFDRIGRIDG